MATFQGVVVAVRAHPGCPPAVELLRALLSRTLGLGGDRAEPVLDELSLAGVGRFIKSDRCTGTGMGHREWETGMGHREWDVSRFIKSDRCTGTGRGTETGMGTGIGMGTGPVHQE